ncbi:zinc-binding alcohol dehydrogenase [Caldicoprobacter algeriensis]|uniref:zinc-dependent alcohol dehydrogenase n=1 Tax=Caldicoprobacter algeriensis TaxID=699281 RepID=UPI002079C2F8|nr:zinc-binding alcohol dehydrogenase [Caldicoprobacter algeriensis]MCM8900070.1 zinc-binding alcohol dehydrogenase [Caldicoprobacter algeriensis]
MGKIIKLLGPKSIGFEEYEEEELRPDEVRIKTLFSGISAGTQLTLYRGKNPYLSGKWDPDLRIFDHTGEASAKFPVKGMWAYEEVGIVVEIGTDVSKASVGDVIYGAWGHKSTHVVKEEFAVDHKLPKELDPICGIFAQMGAIALNAILDANIHVGETVAIFGQGVPGQMVTQLAKLNGARVIAVDLDDSRLEYSKKFGADIVLNPKKCDAAKEIKKLTDGRGADVSIEISGFASALNEAIRATCYNGTVVCSGFITGEAKGLFLGKEFHHNRIKIVCSQISGVSLDVSNRWDRLRMEKTIMQLQAEGKVNFKGLITHIIPFEKAPEAYRMLDEGTKDCLQVVLKFDEE